MNKIRYSNALQLFMAVFFVFFLASGTMPVPSFKSDQLTNARVRLAFYEKEMVVRTQMALRGIDTNRFQLYIRAFKMEECLEVWARNSDSDPYVQLFNYPLCSTVGAVGPKRRQGDLQIPEGFYYISKFNPVSDHYLSLKINYPNKADSILGEKGNLGNLIFLHGGCESIGCLPITDDKMKELYVMGVMAKDGGQDTIPVHIFPTRLNYANYKLLTEIPEYKPHMRFWGSLRTCYLYFEEKGTLPKITVNEAGEYLFWRHSIGG